MSKPFISEGAQVKNMYHQLDRKDQYLIWLQQTPLHFCHRLCLMKVACPHQSDKGNKGRKQKEEMRLNYIQKQHVIRSHELAGYRWHWAHEAAKGWEQKLCKHPEGAEDGFIPGGKEKGLEERSCLIWAVGNSTCRLICISLYWARRPVQIDGTAWGWFQVITLSEKRVSAQSGIKWFLHTL